MEKIDPTLFRYLPKQEKENTAAIYRDEAGNIVIHHIKGVFPITSFKNVTQMRNAYKFKYKKMPWERF